MRSSSENVLQSHNKSIFQDGMKCPIRWCLFELTGDLPLELRFRGYMHASLCLSHYVHQSKFGSKWNRSLRMNPGQRDSCSSWLWMGIIRSFKLSEQFAVWYSRPGAWLRIGQMECERVAGSQMPLDSLSMTVTIKVSGSTDPLNKMLLYR